MLFHPTFKAEKERRLIFDEGAPAAGPGEGGAGAPPAAETLTEKQKEIQGKIDTIKADPEAARDLVDFQVQKAGETEDALQARFEKAVLDAANTYRQELLGIPGGGDHLKTVNEAFAPAGVTFELGADGKLKIAAKAAEEAGDEEGEEEAEEPRLSPEDEQILQDALTSLPEDMRKTAEQIMREILSDPKMRAATVTFSRALGNLSPEARRYFDQNAATILSGGKLAEAGPQLSKRANAFMNKVGLERAVATPQVRKEIEGFWKELGPDGQALAKKLVERIQSALAKESNNLSDEERGDIIEGAEKELEKFDATKASEIDKNIMLARMQMRGIDTSNPDGIFKKPPELKVFEGSPMERGFNQIMGLIGYVLMSIQKMKDSMKPGEKKGPDAPAGDKGKAGPEAQALEKEGAKKKLREEMKTKSETGDQLKTEKEGRQATLKTEIPKTEKEVEELTKQLEGVAEGDEKTRSQEHLKEMSDGLAKNKQESAQLAQDIAALQEMKTTTENLKSILSAGKDALFAYLDRGDVGRKVSGGRVLADNLQKISFVVNDRFELALANDRGAPIDSTVLKDVSGAITFKMRSGVDYLAVDDQGVLKQPENLQTLFNQLLDGFKAEVKAEETPAAPAPAPAAPPAGGPPAPRP